MPWASPSSISELILTDWLLYPLNCAERFTHIDLFKPYRELKSRYLYFCFLQRLSVSALTARSGVGRVGLWHQEVQARWSILHFSWFTSGLSARFWLNKASLSLKKHLGTSDPVGRMSRSEKGVFGLSLTENSQTSSDIKGYLLSYSFQGKANRQMISKVVHS